MPLHSLWATRRAPRGKGKPCGMTLTELLVASGLMIFVSLVFFQIFSPTLQRTIRIDKKQEQLQKFILFKEYLTKRLNNVQIKEVTQTEIKFYLPDQAETGSGKLNLIDTSEMTQWNTSAVYTIAINETAEDSVIQESLEGSPSSDSRNRKLWSLGPGGTLAFDAAKLPLLGITVKAREKVNNELIPWERHFNVYLPTFH
ncbi:MAG: type II secretion system protein [Candidatus Eremiobacteraeota bacterium]|nr:type II secretion system protein [Candidatus Eremiobacteraeota bacterium]